MKTHHRSRRTRLITAALGVSLALTACAQADPSAETTAPGQSTEPTQTAAEGEQIVLQFAWWGGDKRHSYTQELIELYEAQNPHVRIEGTFADFSGYWDRLNTNIAGGNIPDVMQQETRYIRQYVDRGLLADLNQFVPDLLEVADLDPAVAETGVLDGSLYAVPIGVNAFAVAIDPQAFADAGVEIPDDTTWTWQDWVEVAAEVSAADEQIIGVQPRPEHDAMLDIFARQRGEALFTPDGEVGVTKETLVDFWSTVMSFHETGGAPPASLTVEIDNAALEGSILATNSGATAPFWSNQIPALEAAADREMSLLRFPGESTEEHTGMFLKPAQFWAVSATTEYPEEAAKFVDFLLNSPESIEIMLSERGLPANLVRRDEVLGDLPPADQRTATFLAEIGPELEDPPALPPPGGGEMEGILKGLYEELLFEQITVEEAADLYLERANAAIT